MSFFDSKQEVFDIILTEYGKKILSEGKFKPKYYSFFDDDVIYSSLYGNLTESQNSIQTRILEETVYLKPFNIISSSNVTTYQQKNFSVSNNSLNLPLGSSDFSSTYYPSWNIKTLKGNISSSIFLGNIISSGDFSTFFNYGNDVINKTFITQINMATQSSEIEIVPSRLDVLFDFNNFIISKVFSDGSLVTAKINENIFDITEENCYDLKENFEIEIFEVQTEQDGKEILKPLNFIKEAQDIEQNILLDSPQSGLTKEQISSLTISSLNETFAESYFTILVDDEIPFEQLKIERLNIYNNNINGLKPNKDNC